MNLELVFIPHSIVSAHYANKYPNIRSKFQNIKPISHKTAVVCVLIYIYLHEV